MKILSIVIVRREPSPAKILCSEFDLSSFNFFQKTRQISYFVEVNILHCISGQEFLTFFSVTLSERTPPGVRQSVEQEGITLRMILLLMIF